MLLHILFRRVREREWNCWDFVFCVSLIPFHWIQLQHVPGADVEKIFKLFIQTIRSFHIAAAAAAHTRESHAERDSFSPYSLTFLLYRFNNSLSLSLPYIQFPLHTWCLSHVYTSWQRLLPQCIHFPHCVKLEVGVGIRKKRRREAKWMFHQPQNKYFTFQACFLFHIPSTASFINNNIRPNLFFVFLFFLLFLHTSSTTISIDD